MSAGRPVICSDIDGYRAAVGKSAGVRLVPPRSAEALEQAILDLAGSPDQRRQMGVEGRAYALGFDWSIVAARVREEYLATIDVRRHGGSPRRVIVPSAPPATSQRAGEPYRRAAGP
jgi:glycosyltransferase involved in cell wall biosynthesis